MPEQIKLHSSACDKKFCPDSCRSPVKKQKSGFVLENAAIEHGEDALLHSKIHLCTPETKVNSSWMSFFLSSC